MTLKAKAHANQQSNVTFFHRKRDGAGLGPIAVPRLRRDFRHSGRFLADAILVPNDGDVNLNLKAVSSDTCGEAREGCSVRSGARPAGNSFVAGGAFISEEGSWGEVRPIAALDDDDELDEDDDEDLEDEDDLDLDDEDEDEDGDEDDLDDEDEDEDDLDDDDLDDEEDDEEEEE